MYNKNMKIDKNKIKEILIEQGQKDVDMELLLKNYPEEISDNLRKCYENYIEKREIIDAEFNGISLLKIMENLHEHFFLALRDMNKLMSTSENSKERERWKRILTSSRYYE